MPLINIEL